MKELKDAETFTSAYLRPGTEEVSIFKYNVGLNSSNKISIKLLNIQIGNKKDVCTVCDHIYSFVSKRTHYFSSVSYWKQYMSRFELSDEQLQEIVDDAKKEVKEDFWKKYNIDRAEDRYLEWQERNDKFIEGLKALQKKYKVVLYSETIQDDYDDYHSTLGIRDTKYPNHFAEEWDVTEL